MAITRVLTTTDTAHIANNEPTLPGDYYANAWATNWGRISYGLLRFYDLSNIPANAVIQLARLRWRMYDSESGSQYERVGTSPLTIRANRITSGWARHTVTWNTKPTFTSVDAPSVTDAFSAPGEFSPWWDVTAHVAAMVAGTVPNYGWLLECITYGGGVAFYNGGWWIEVIAELEVTYVAPAECATDEPAGSQGDPSEVTNKISGFDLVASFNSPGGEPISSVTAQVYDPDGNQAWEYSEVYNALSANQQTVEVDTTGFVAVGGAALARDTGRAWQGLASLKITPAAAAGSGVRITYPSPTVSEHYSGRMMVSGPVGKDLVLDFLAVDAGGATLNQRSLTRRVLGNTMLTGCALPEARNWVEFDIEDLVAVAGAAEIRMELKTVDASAPIFYIDGNILTPDAAVAPWISQGSVRFVIPPNLLRYGVVYAWRCKATNTAGDSGWTPLAYFTCVLSAVTGLVAAGIAAEALIRLTWNPHPGEALAGYRVYRGPTGGELAEHSIDLAGSERFDDDAAQVVVEYDYRVAAVAADGYEGPPSGLVTASVTFEGCWLGDLQVYPVERPQIEHVRLASRRIALDGSTVVQDYGFGPRTLAFALLYRSKDEKDALLLVLTPAALLSYRDQRGQVFRGRLDGNPAERPYPVGGVDCGALSVRLVEVKPRA